MQIGAGCPVYAEARKDRPLEAFAEAPRAVIEYEDAEDAAMLKACQ